MMRGRPLKFLLTPFNDDGRSPPLPLPARVSVGTSSRHDLNPCQSLFQCCTPFGGSMLRSLPAIDIGEAA
jgi:hypothetical protein